MMENKKKKWLKSEIEFLKTNYSIFGVTVMAKVLGRNVSGVSSRTFRLGLKKSVTGKYNSNWKGDGVRYEAIHAWVKRRLQKPSGCSNCLKENKRLDLCYKNHDYGPNKGKYSRDLSLWLWLCRSCHMIKDGRMKSLFINHMLWRYKNESLCSM